MEEIQKQYQNICLALGDIEVKIQGLKNHRSQLFEQLNKLDEEASKIQAEQAKAAGKAKDNENV